MDERGLPGVDPGPDHGIGPVPGPGGPVMDSQADGDFDEWTAWLDREVAAGRDPAPPERVAATEGMSISLGDAVDIDPGLLATVCGPEGLGGESLGAQFGQDAAADALSPTPVLAALTEAAVAGVTRLTDDQLIGVLRAARRQENREAWKKALVIAEFARRRTAEFKAAEARGVRVHCRPGQFPGEELAMELMAGPVEAAHAIDDATDLASRLPATLAGMAAGLIDEARAGVIAMYTRSLTLADAALADGILAALAPTLRLDQLARKAAALEMRLDPEAVKARKEHARRTRQRVEVRREESGNALVAGREMDTGDALAAKAHIHALAQRLRGAGMPGTLDQLRLLVFTDLTAGRNPLDRLNPPGAQPGTEDQANQDSSAPNPGDSPPQQDAARAEDAQPDDNGTPEHHNEDWGHGNGESPDYQDDDRCDRGDPGFSTLRDTPVPDPGDAAASQPPAGEVDTQGAGPNDSGALDYESDDCSDRDYDDAPAPEAGPPAPMPATVNPPPPIPATINPPPPIPATINPPPPIPATINLLVHAGTLFGWDSTPTEAGGWGLLDSEETRAIVAAASRYPATRWCVTVIGRDGTALAHGCSPGQHPWTPGYLQAPRPPDSASPRAPSPAQARQLGDFLRRLNVTLTPIARDGCDHAAAEPGYTPSRRLAHLVRARTATCDAPGCSAQAVHADLDHTAPYPEGPTEQCNLGPKCRRHHQAKQAPGWKVDQPEAGVIRWTLPTGRTHTTTPTVYDFPLAPTVYDSPPTPTVYDSPPTPTVYDSPPTPTV